jgi:hypothetical protein
MTMFKGVGCVGFGTCNLGFIVMVCPNSKTNLGKHDEFYNLSFISWVLGGLVYKLGFRGFDISWVLCVWHANGV